MVEPSRNNAYSFIPPLPQRDLRDLTRQRTNLVRERASITNRLQKVLEWANIKLASVVTDITGVSARSILKALVDGENDVRVLVSHAKGSLIRKRVELEKALQGQVREHHRFLIAQHLSHLDSIPGIARQTAELLIAEIGCDLSRFKIAAHLAKWAKLCPGNYESAGQRLGGRTGQSNTWLRSALVQAANAAVRCKNSYFSAVYRRLVARRGRKKAIVAVAHRIIIALYHMLTKQEPYRDLGANYLDSRSCDRLLQRLSRQATQLGYQVEFTPIP